jgi:NADPH:quinone reductase-like Zn-dependent oxidoreductase
MQAIIINSYGGAEVMKLQEIEAPKPGRSEVLVKVHAASVNPIDWKVRRGDLKLFLSKKFPKVTGVDFAGVIEQVGASVKNFKPGDAVFGMANPIKSRYGSYAQYVIAESNCIASKPDELSFVDAASLPVAALTALKSLKDMIGVRPGQSVLINGASGGVGTFAVQIAKVIGAKIYATCSASNLDFVRELGADQVYDYKTVALDQLKEKFDGVFDASAKLSLSQAKQLVKRGGTFVTTVPSPESSLAILISMVLPVLKVRLVIASSGTRVPEELTELAQLVISGKVQPIIAQTIELADVPAAHQQSEKGHARGKTVIQILD